MTDIPARARVVIIGGGVIGTSIAYHLGHLGWSDVVLLERDRLTSGTTWHAAGLMTCFGSMSETSMSMRQYTRELYKRLEAETGLSTGFKPVGFIEAAADEGRLEEYRRVASFNRHVGLDVQEITPREIDDLFPFADTSDLLAGFYVPQDGRVNPVDATMSLAKGARMQGVSIVEGVTVHEVLTTDRRVTGVSTSEGDIECEYVVNCAGMWARQLGERNGVVIPLQAAEHYYLITEPIDGVDPAWPVFEDPSRHGYYREEGGGLMVGLFEPVCAPWNVDRIPSDFSFGEITPDWDRMGPYVERAMQRVPDHPGVRHPHVLLRARVVHARPRTHRRRGSRHRQLLRGRRHELRRHPHGRRHGPHRRAVDRRRSSRRRRHGLQHRPHAGLPAEPALPRGAHG